MSGSEIRNSAAGNPYVSPQGWETDPAQPNQSWRKPFAVLTVSWACGAFSSIYSTIAAAILSDGTTGSAARLEEALRVQIPFHALSLAASAVGVFMLLRTGKSATSRWLAGMACIAVLVQISIEGYAILYFENATGFTPTMLRFWLMAYRVGPFLLFLSLFVFAATITNRTHRNWFRLAMFVGGGLPLVLYLLNIGGVRLPQGYYHHAWQIIQLAVAFYMLRFWPQLVTDADFSLGVKDQ